MAKMSRPGMSDSNRLTSHIDTWSSLVPNFQFRFCSSALLPRVSRDRSSRFCILWRHVMQEGRRMIPWRRCRLLSRSGPSSRPSDGG